MSSIVQDVDRHSRGRPQHCPDSLTVIFAQSMEDNSKAERVERSGAEDTSFFIVKNPDVCLKLIPNDSFKHQINQIRTELIAKKTRITCRCGKIS